MRKDVFNWYEQDCVTFPMVYASVSLSYFNRVWREQVPEVKLRKVLRFNKCATCENLRKIRWDRGRSSTEKAQAMAKLTVHYKFVKRERTHAMVAAARGVMSPKDVLSMAQDGTSQLPHGLPQFAQALHGQEEAHNRLHHHITLTMVHGMGTKCYVTRDNTAGDPNLTIECLQRTLEWVEQTRGFLPNKLCLQLDNCWRENKNSYVLNWLGSLVERGLFPGGIYMSFLPVGHTHNEVDAVAAVISIAVRRRDIILPAHLYALLRECFHELDVEIVHKVADTKTFLNPHLVDPKSWTHSRWMRHVSAKRGTSGCINLPMVIFTARQRPAVEIHGLTLKRC